MNVKRGGGGLLLIEMLIALMFFSLAAGICLRLFVGARQTSYDSADLSRAAIEAQSMAECFKSAGGDLEGAAAALGKGAAVVPRSGMYGLVVITYGGDWEPSASDVEYTATLTLSAPESGVTRAQVQIFRGDEELFSMPVAALEVSP